VSILVHILVMLLGGIRKKRRKTIY